MYGILVLIKCCGKRKTHCYFSCITYTLTMRYKVFSYHLHFTPKTHVMWYKYYTHFTWMCLSANIWLGGTCTIAKLFWWSKSACLACINNWIRYLIELLIIILKLKWIASERTNRWVRMEECERNWLLN